MDLNLPSMKPLVETSSSDGSEFVEDGSAPASTFDQRRLTESQQECELHRLSGSEIVRFRVWKRFTHIRSVFLVHPINPPNPPASTSVELRPSLSHLFALSIRVLFPFGLDELGQGGIDNGELLLVVHCTKKKRNRSDADRETSESSRGREERRKIQHTEALTENHDTSTPLHAVLDRYTQNGQSDLLIRAL